MTLDEYNGFCASLPHTTHVVQWGGAHVWKVGGKVFAIGGWNEGAGLSVTFKVSDMAFDILKEQPGLRPAPYLASRGMKWIQRISGETMDAEGLRDYIRESHRLIAAKLTKAVRKDLGLPA
ncbi:MAG: MmcQ/YjbR family DNA-binding protein [Proteobacteria bacterium]|nr:MmcQ/YjbR family DNA-binding protein [Pseudomonadota bacterium]